MKELVQNKDIYRRANVLKQVLLNSNNLQQGTFPHGDIILSIIIVSLLGIYYTSMFFRTSTFWKRLLFQKNNIPHNLLSADPLFQKNYFSKHTFLEEVLFQSYNSFLQLTSYLSVSN